MHYQKRLVQVHGEHMNHGGKNHHQEKGHMNDVPPGKQMFAGIKLGNLADLAEILLQKHPGHLYQSITMFLDGLRFHGPGN